MKGSVATAFVGERKAGETTRSAPQKRKRQRKEQELFAHDLSFSAAWLTKSLLELQLEEVEVELGELEDSTGVGVGGVG